jgi:predicted nucleic acid-binding protein
MRAFLDASILVAASLSSEGGSFRLIREASLRNIHLLTSKYAYREAEGALQKKYPSELLSLFQLSAYFEITPNPQEKFVREMINVINIKDAPILASAIQEKCDTLFSMDRKHFIGNKEIKRICPNLLVTTPGDFIQKYF